MKSVIVDDSDDDEENEYLLVQSEPELVRVDISADGTGNEVTNDSDSDSVEIHDSEVISTGEDDEVDTSVLSDGIVAENEVDTSGVVEGNVGEEMETALGDSETVDDVEDQGSSSGGGGEEGELDSDPLPKQAAKDGPLSPEEEPPDEASEPVVIRRSNRTPVPKLKFSLDELGGDPTLR